MESKRPLDSPLSLLSVNINGLRYFDSYAYFIVLPFIDIKYVNLGQLLQVSTLLYFIAISFSVFFSGMIIDRYGVKKPIFLSLGLLMAGSAISGFSQGLVSQSVGRTLSGFGLGMLPTLIRIFAFSIDKKHVGGVISFLNSFKNASAIIAMLVAGFMISWVGWRGVFYIIFIFMCIELVWIFLYSKNVFIQYGPATQFPIKNLKVLLANPACLSWIIACGSLASTSVLFVLTLSITLSKQLHYLSHNISYILSIIYFVAGVASIINYYLLKKVQRWWLAICGYLIMLSAIIILLALYQHKFEDIYLYAAIIYFVGFSVASPVFIGRTIRLSKYVSIAWGTALMTTVFNLFNGANSYLMHYVYIDNSTKLGLYLACLLGISLFFGLLSFSFSRGRAS